MIKKIFSVQSHSITGAAIIIGAASFISRFVGLVRDRMFTHYFGAGDILDAYYAAFRVPDFIFNLIIVGALSAGFIPVFIEVWERDKPKAWEITNSIMNLVFILMGIASIALMIFARPVMHVVTPGFTGEKFDLVVQLTRIMLLSPVILGLSGVVSTVLHSFKHFLIFSLAPIIYNLSIIVDLLLFVPRFGVAGLAYGVILGACLHLAIQIPSLLQHGYHYKPIIKLRDVFVRKVLSLIVPRTFGLATQQINFLIIDSLASTLAAGSIAIFYLAHSLYYVPIGLIGYSFSLAAFPVFAEYIAARNPDGLAKHFARTVSQILFLIIPFMILCIVLRAQIIRVAFGSGKFDWTDTILTADTLAILSISLVAHCIMLLAARALYALQDTKMPFIASALGVITNLTTALALKPTFGILGLALALSLALIVQCSFLWLTLRAKVGSLNEGLIMKKLLKITLAAAGMALVTQKLKYPISELVDMTRLWGIIVQGGISGTIGFIVYGLICHLLKLEEMTLLRNRLMVRGQKN